MNRQQFYNSLKYFHLKPYVDDGRICFSGSSSLVDARKALDELPEVEGELILRLAVHDADLLDAIQERACIRWVDGYSDSLYITVMDNIKPVPETREYSEKPDKEQAAFLRRMGFSEADLMNREKHPSVWVKRKPRTDWDVELAKYR